MALNGGLISVSEIDKASTECSIIVRIVHFWVSMDKNGNKKGVEMVLLDKEASDSSNIHRIIFFISY